MLTGRTFRFHETLNIPTSSVYEITNDNGLFVCCGVTYNKIANSVSMTGEETIYYFWDDKVLIAYQNGEFLSDKYRTIVFINEQGAGSDKVSPDISTFMSFLTNNTSELHIDYNLKGKSFRFHETINVPDEYELSAVKDISVAEENFIFTCDNTSYHEMSNIVFQPTSIFHYSLRIDDRSVIGYSISENDGTTKEEYREITFIDEPTVFLPDKYTFVQWLYDNADETTQEYIATSEDLTAVADAIRQKGNTSVSISYPAGFINAIETMQVPFLSRVETVTPTESVQTITPTGSYFGVQQVTVNAISSTYVGTSVTRKAATTYTPTTTNQTIASGTYFTGAQTIKGDANLTAANIASGTTIFGVSGTYSHVTLAWNYVIYSMIYASAISLIAANETTLSSFFFVQNTNINTQTFEKATTIQTGAFIECTGTNLKFPLVTVVGTSAFRSCWSLTTISIPKCTAVNAAGFEYCSTLSNIYAPSLKTLGNYAFYSCWSLSSFTAYPSVTTIGNYAFGQCSTLSAVSLPACTTVNQSAFRGCSNLKTVSLPACTTIGNYAFYGCSTLPSVTLPKCTSMGTYAFYGCSSISMISMSMCSVIGASAFVGCSKLSKIYLTSTTLVPYVATAFVSTPILNSTYLGAFGSVYVKSTLLASYKAAAGWSSISARLVGA